MFLALMTLTMNAMADVTSLSAGISFVQGGVSYSITNSKDYTLEGDEYGFRMTFTRPKTTFRYEFEISSHPEKQEQYKKTIGKIIEVDILRNCLKYMMKHGLSYSAMSALFYAAGTAELASNGEVSKRSAVRNSYSVVTMACPSDILRGQAAE